MRTKQTGPKRPKHDVNDTPINSPPVPDVKSPAQPHELSDKERAKLRDFLDKDGPSPPFSITTIPLNSPKKRKRSTTNLHTQSDLFEDRLSVQYEIKPLNNWESLRRYKKFTVGNESIAVGEHILVKHDVSEDQKIDIAAQWKAKVLEVRALDPEHVYIRVAWLNRPEDLDSGRKDYHGLNELIPTNHMDIIDAMTVNGRLELYHWAEEDDESAMPGIGEHFWRQTYDFAGTKTFSELRHICIDDRPQNPDKMILQCPSETCGKWMHLKCIAEAAVGQTGEAQQKQSSNAKRKSTSTKKGARAKTPELTPGSTAQAKALNQATGVTAEVFVKGLPADEKDGGPPEGSTRVVVTREDGEDQVRDVKCLFCGTAIE
ncbi:hypothetical protein LTR86_004148 [Recurvomyces mirabilis]|nr:hypothetical protein LTR86_004148 [Recurvomyces mirabilis]